MPSFLRARLEGVLGVDRVEVINVGAGGEDSHRVRQIGEEVLAYEPDLLIVAMGNNEGTLPPGQVREHLHRLGGFRLLTQLLAPGSDARGRSTFTAQHADDEQLAINFDENLRRLAVAAEEAGTPILLAALPVNLRHEGYAMSPFGPESATEVEFREVSDACIVRGRDAYRAGDFALAREALEACDDVAESLRWIGLSLLADGRLEEGCQALEQSIELLPRTRTRCSFDALIRARVQRHDHGFSDVEAQAMLFGLGEAELHPPSDERDSENVVVS
jgi:hypothetical protein